MKKLLIAMTAAAVGTCAWATGEQTLLSESFTGWTLTDNTWWSYSAAAADGELTVTNTAAESAEAEYKLALNTGSKVLTGSFTSDDEPKAIGTDGLYFKSSVTFKDPSDTLPELKDSDKFALVVLDNVESIDAEKATDPATNLWVIAKYGDAGQRAYQLDVVVTPTWLEDEHTIVVKAYDNVMASGNCAGFLVKVDNEDNDTVCRVVQSCAIVDGVIDFNTSCAYDMWLDGADKNLGYLGYPKSAILGAVQKRYTDGTLILSNVPGSDTLASVDFQGQGVIDDVSLATTGSGFGTDSLALTVVADGVTLVDTDETLYFAAIGDKVTIKFTVNEGFELSSPTGLTPVDGVYTYEYTTKANNEEVTISAFKPVAIVDGTKYETVQAALEAIAENGGTGTVVLNDNVTLTDDDVDSNGLTITSGEITIDLNGNTIVAEECYTIGVTGGKLIVQDSKGGGAILASEGYGAIDASAGVTEIQAGTIGLIVNGTADTLKLVGGSYTDVGETFYLTTEQMKYGDKQYEATLADSVWTVAEKVATTYAVTYTAENATITKDGAAFTSGTALVSGTYTFKVKAAEGYKVDSVTVGGVAATVAEDGTFSVTVTDAAVAIVVTTSEIVTGPTIDDEDGTITVDNSGNATINTTNATITVTGTVTGDVIVTPSVGTVNVTLAQGKTVKIYSDETNITGAFTVTTDGTTTTIALNPEGEVEINGAKIKVMPEMAQAGNGEDAMKAPLEVGTDVAVGVKTIPGLMYQLIRSDAPNGTFEGVGDAVKGTGVPVKLEDKNKPNGKGFYKIKVSQR